MTDHQATNERTERQAEAARLRDLILEAVDALERSSAHPLTITSVPTYEAMRLELRSMARQLVQHADVRAAELAGVYELGRLCYFQGRTHLILVLALANGRASDPFVGSLTSASEALYEAYLVLFGRMNDEREAAGRRFLELAGVTSPRTMRELEHEASSLRRTCEHLEAELAAMVAKLAELEPLAELRGRRIADLEDELGAIRALAERRAVHIAELELALADETETDPGRIADLEAALELARGAR